MNRLLLSVTLLFCGSSLFASDATIEGDYLESRTADVYTAACFANAEVNIAGKRALLAWRVRNGYWHGQDLSGLSVVAVVRAKATLGDPFADPLPARSVLLVDERADAAQRSALIAFARAQGGELLSHTIAIHPVAIELALSPHEGYASLRAGELAELTTRPFEEHDKICGNEGLYYQPLTELSQFHAAYALTHRYNGSELGGRWSKPDKRSAFLGTFSY